MPASLNDRRSWQSFPPDPTNMASSGKQGRGAVGEEQCLTQSKKVQKEEKKTNFETRVVGRRD